MLSIKRASLCFLKICITEFFYFFVLSIRVVIKIFGKNIGIKIFSNCTQSKRRFRRKFVCVCGYSKENCVSETIKIEESTAT